jgi:hypothetical protein
MIRSMKIVLPCLMAVALSACHSKDREELNKFVGDLHNAVQSLSAEKTSGTLSLRIDAWNAAVAILPSHGSSASLKLPEALSHDLDQATSASDKARIFLIRDGSIAAQQEVEPGLLVKPGYSNKPEMFFKLTRSKTPDHLYELELL